MCLTFGRKPYHCHMTFQVASSPSVKFHELNSLILSFYIAFTFHATFSL